MVGPVTQRPVLTPMCSCLGCLFFFNGPSPTEIFTLSLHDALPILVSGPIPGVFPPARAGPGLVPRRARVLVSPDAGGPRSEEHTSELQSQFHLVCRLLLEKKKRRGQRRPSHRR